MLKKARGFTLIELLIVVAIIGILTTLLIPNSIIAIQKAKQKSTMKDIVVISTALEHYVIDNGIAPAQSGTYVGGDAFYRSLSPFYLKVMPTNDEWSNDYRIYCDTAVNGNYGISGSLGDDFLVSSWGRDKTVEGFTYAASSAGAGIYVVSAAADFNNDLVMWNGSWIRAPKK